MLWCSAVKGDFLNAASPKIILSLFQVLMQKVV